MYSPTQTGDATSISIQPNCGELSFERTIAPLIAKSPRISPVAWYSMSVLESLALVVRVMSRLFMTDAATGVARGGTCSRGAWN